MEKQVFINLREELESLTKVYNDLSQKSRDMLEDISSKLAVSNGEITKEIKFLYKDRDVVLKNMGKTSQKINRTKNKMCAV